MKELIDKVRHDPPKIRIGKKGITENIIKEIKSLLKIDKTIKIKCLHVIPKESIEAIAQNIVKLTNSNIIELRGKTIILQIKN